MYLAYDSPQSYLQSSSSFTPKAGKQIPHGRNWLCSNREHTNRCIVTYYVLHGLFLLDFFLPWLLPGLHYNWPYYLCLVSLFHQLSRSPLLLLFGHF